MDFKAIFDPKDRPLLIAGPCSAETEEQVLQTAHGLAKGGGVDLFRAGIWKPRTRPGAFEGVGAVGLPWLQRVQAETGLRVTTEVAKTEHVEAALKNNIDVLWIGARTTVNPFSVQEVADALQGVDIPVMVKNPINPDVKLWIGAIERLYKAGIRQVAAIHRGFSDFSEKKYRNAPLWQLPIELRRQFPNLELICDHSHICGRRAILHEVAQRSYDLGYDGLMTEVHPRPDEAWSDAAQQVTPTAYFKMMQQLIHRQATTEDKQFQETLEYFRHQIDSLDKQILQLLGDRMQIAEEIGGFKRKNNVSIFQVERWKATFARTFAKGRELGLSDTFIANYLTALHDESIERQEKVMND